MIIVNSFRKAEGSNTLKQTRSVNLPKIWQDLQAPPKKYAQKRFTKNSKRLDANRQLGQKLVESPYHSC